MKRLGAKDREAVARQCDEAAKRWARYALQSNTPSGLEEHTKVASWFVEQAVRLRHGR